jgi:hypothetical protein
MEEPQRARKRLREDGEEESTELRAEDGDGPETGAPEAKVHARADGPELVVLSDGTAELRVAVGAELGELIGELTRLQRAAPAASASGAGDGGPLQGEEFVDLGRDVRLGVSSFRGRRYAQVREHYAQDGEMKPGAKGVTLSADAWRALVAMAEDIERLLAAGRDADVGMLDKDKKVRISVFRGQPARVDLRAFYLPKEGSEMLPTKKGVALSAAQWAILRANVHRIVF